LNLKKAKAIRRLIRRTYPDMPERKLVAFKTAKIIGYKDAMTKDDKLVQVPVYALMAQNAIGTKRHVYLAMKRAARDQRN